MKENIKKSTRSYRLSQFLLRARSDGNLTLKKVEELSKNYDEKINFHYLSKVERGEVMPSLPKLLTLARIYKFPPALLFDILELEKYEKVKPTIDDYKQCKAYAIACADHGDFDKAFGAFHKCIKIIEKEKDSSKKQEEISEINLCTGTLLKRMGKLTLAKEELEKALLNNKISNYHKMRIHCEFASIYREQMNIQLAMLHINEASRIAEDEEDDSVKVSTLGIKANILAVSAKPEEATPLYTKAISIAKKLDLTSDLIILSYSFGLYCIQMGKFQEAAKLLESCASMAKTEGLKKHCSACLANLGEAYFHLKEYEKAKIHLSEAARIAREYEYAKNAFVAIFYLWKIAMYEGNKELQQNFFKSLKFYRAKIESKFDEIIEFENYCLGHSLK